MRTPRLLLLGVVLSSFALLGATCDNNKDDDEDPLPQRALAATPFLRTYYQTQTIPKSMRAIKIPEGNNFEDQELQVDFDMSGAELVTDVEVGLSVGANRSADYDLYARLISAVGTASAWKPIDVKTAEKFQVQVVISFAFEFDNEISSGKWKLQLRDPIEDNDSRLMFRNASLRINDGESSTIRGLANDATQTVALSGTLGRYDILPEVFGGVNSGDIGIWGFNAMLSNVFTMTTAFSVRVATVQFAIAENDSADASKNLVLVVVPPSGGLSIWVPGDSVESLKPAGSSVNFRRYAMDISIDMAGEPSTGTWIVALVDVKHDSNTMSLSSVGPVTAALVNFPITLSLSGRTY